MKQETKVKINEPLSTEDIIKVFDSSGIRRPTKDPVRISKMFSNSDLVASAWVNEELVGVARALTDFSYCCYVSDIAVAKDYQNRGIGKMLLESLKEKAGSQCVFFLHAAPSAREYYPKIGMNPMEDCFYIPRDPY